MASYGKSRVMGGVARTREKFGYEGDDVDFGAAHLCAGRSSFGNYVNWEYNLEL